MYFRVEKKIVCEFMNELLRYEKLDFKLKLFYQSGKRLILLFTIFKIKVYLLIVFPGK